MSLTFNEKRVQTRVLRSSSFWLHPQSRSFDSSGVKSLSIDDFEKLCGPIRDAKFDAELFDEIFKYSIDMAEGFLVEYAATIGYELTEFHLPPGYSLVSRLPNGDPGNELDLILTVLQSIVKGNESISKRTEIMERIEKLKETKANLEQDGCEIPHVFATLEQRISNCDEVSEQDIQDFVDQIEKDGSYHANIPTFTKREYLLKGVKHVQFLQKAHLNSNTINKSFYDSLLTTMVSIVSRLSTDELSEALEASKDHFKAVENKRRDYVSSLKESSKDGKNGVFTTRVLLLGPKAASEDLAKLLREDPVSGMQLCEDLLSDLPAPLSKELFEDEPQILLRTLFSITGFFAGSYFEKPLTCIVLPGIFPLRKLLAIMSKPVFGRHIVQLLSCHIVRRCIEGIDVSMPEWEETVQCVINCMSIVVDRMDVRLIRSLLELMKGHSGDESEELQWLAKYENHVTVGQWVGLIEKEEKKVMESTSEGSTGKKDEEKGEKKTRKEKEQERKKEKEKERRKERKMKRNKELKEERLRRGVKGEGKKKEEKDDKTDVEDGDVKEEKDAVTIEEEDTQVTDSFISDTSHEEETSEMEQVNAAEETGLINCTDDEEGVTNEEESSGRTGYDSVPSVANAADEDDIYPDTQGDLPIRDEPMPGREEAVVKETDGDDEEEQKLYPTQSSAHSQEDSGCTDGVSDFNEIEQV